VPIEGLLCLLWDVPENRQRRVVKALQERSLVDYEDGEFWLHPVIRGEAIKRIRGCGDWETANRRLAEFWTKNVKTVETVEDALEAFESYYLYMEINDTKSASNVLLKKRKNYWAASLTKELSYSSLGSSCCRLGLFEQMASAITQVVDEIEDGYSRGYLYHKLGNIYLLSGGIQRAIVTYERSRELAAQTNNFDLELDCLHHLGLCKISLWELEEALSLYEELNRYSGHIEFHRRAVLAWHRLAVINSYLDNQSAATLFLEKLESENSSDFLLVDLLGIRGAGYSLLNQGLTLGKLGAYEKAIKAYERTIAYARKGHFTEIQAIALTGIAEIDRNCGAYKSAILNHVESLDLLKAIGAKPDIAEAYYQFGLTHQAMGETDKSNENFQEAIQIFTEMEAPKQVERVRRSMNGKT